MARGFVENSAERDNTQNPARISAVKLLFETYDLLNFCKTFDFCLKICSDLYVFMNGVSRLSSDTASGIPLYVCFETVKMSTSSARGSWLSI